MFRLYKFVIDVELIEMIEIMYGNMYVDYIRYFECVCIGVGR